MTAPSVKLCDSVRGFKPRAVSKGRSFAAVESNDDFIFVRLDVFNHCRNFFAAVQLECILARAVGHAQEVIAAAANKKDSIFVVADERVVARHAVNLSFIFGGYELVLVDLPTITSAIRTAPLEKFFALYHALKLFAVKVFCIKNFLWLSCYLPRIIIYFKKYIEIFFAVGKESIYMAMSKILCPTRLLRVLPPTTEFSTKVPT